MKLNERATQAAEWVLASFRSGNVPNALAKCVLPAPHLPMSAWSARNRYICYITGCSDARGFRQWGEVGRKVRKGQGAMSSILVPMIGRKEAGDPESERVVYGFRGIPVWDVSQTEGDDLDYEATERRVLDALPLREAAVAMGVTFATADTSAIGAYGLYSPGRKRILLGVADSSTWLHELAHAADDALGTLAGAKQGDWRAECVAEFSAATLGVLLGDDAAADMGGSWEYISRYADEAKIEPITACLQVIDRVTAVVSHIITLSGHEATALSDKTVPEPVEMELV
jgi:hypothetical protein